MIALAVMLAVAGSPEATPRSDTPATMPTAAASTTVRVAVWGPDQPTDAIASHVLPRLQPTHTVTLTKGGRVTPSALEATGDPVQVWIRVAEDGTVRVLVADRVRTRVTYRELAHGVTELVIEDVALGIVDVVGRLSRDEPLPNASTWDAARAAFLAGTEATRPRVAVGRGPFVGFALGGTAQPPFGPTLAIEGGYMLAGKRRPGFRYSFGARFLHTAFVGGGVYGPQIEGQARVRLGGCGEHLLGFAGLGAGVWYQALPGDTFASGEFSVGAGVYGRVGRHLMVGVEFDVGADILVLYARASALLGFVWHWDGAR